MSDQYQITDNESGMVMTVEGSRAPTQDEAKGLFAKFKSGPQMAPEKSTWDKVKDDLTKPVSIGDLATQGPAYMLRRLGRDVVKPAVPGLLDEEGTILQPDKPRGIIPAATKALSGGAVRKFLPAKEISKDDSVPVSLGKEGYNLVTGVADFAASPMGVGATLAGEPAGLSAEAKTMEQFAGSGEQAVKMLADIAYKRAVKQYGRAVGQYFSADMATGAAQAAVDLYHDHKQMTWGQTAAALEGIVGGGLFGGWLGKKGFSSGEKTRAPAPAPGAEKAEAAPASAPAPPTTPAAPTEPTDAEIDKRLGEIDDMRKAGGLTGQTREEKRLLQLKADRTVKAQAAEKSDLEADKTRHDQLQEELHSMQEGGLPAADIEKTKQQIKGLQDKWGDKLVPPEISPEGKSLLAEHGKGKPEIITDEQDGNAPFSGGRDPREGSPAWARSDGKIVIHRRNFQDWLNSITPSRRSQAVKSLLSEEHIHTLTDRDDAAKYWKQMTGVEKWAMKYRYDPYNQKNLTDVNWGAESIRYHIQQMMRMTPTEVAQEYGGKGATSRRLKIQAIDILDGIVRKARHALSDGTSQTILDRVAQNLETARNAVSGKVVSTEPASYSQDAQKQANDLTAQAAEYRKMGLEGEAKELEDMARMSAEWAKEEVEPGGSGRQQKPDKNQQVFEDLLSRSKWEQMRMAANEGPNSPMIQKANKQLFKMAQAESGQNPTQEAGAAGRGRPKKDPASRIYIKAESPGAQQPMFSDPEVYLGTKGASQAVPPEERALAPGQAPRLPTSTEIEGGATQWVMRELDDAIEKEGRGASLPNLEDFEKYMAKNFHVQPGAAREFFENALMNRLEKASGADLQALLKSAFGHESLLGRGSVPDAPEGRQSGFKLESPDPEKEVAKKEEQMERAPGRRELTTAEATQKRRQKAIALIYNKAVGTSTAEDPSLLARKDIAPNEIRTAPKYGVGGVMNLSRMDANDPELESILYDDSRRSNRDKASVTRRILVVRKKSDGTVSQVSVWRNPTSKRMFITNPDLPAGEGLGLQDALKRYSMVEAYSLDHPVEKFHKRFKDIGDYNAKFGKDAKELSQEAEHYDPSSTREGEFVQSTAPTVTGEDESGNIGPIHPTEGINEGGSGSFMGPDKDLATPGGGEDLRQRSFRPITDNEARAVAKAFGEAETVEDAKKILKGLGQEAYAKAKERWKLAATKVQKAQEQVSGAETERTTAPEEHQTEPGSPEVEAARKRLRAALYDAARATADLNQEAALRSGIAKIARRYERLYGTRETSDFNEKGEQFKTRQKVPPDDLLHSMAKSVFSASLKGALRADPLAAIKSLGGDKAKASPWDRPQTPSGRELTMLNRRPPTDVKSLPFPKQSETPQAVPPPADAMMPAPLKPVETLDGRAFAQIEQSTMTPERRREISQNVVKFTPEEEAEIAKAQAVVEYQKKRAARSAAQTQAEQAGAPKTLNQWMAEHGVSEGSAKAGRRTSDSDPQQETMRFTGLERGVELPRPPKQEGLNLGGAGRAKDPRDQALPFASWINPSAVLEDVGTGGHEAYAKEKYRATSKEMHDRGYKRVYIEKGRIEADGPLSATQRRVLKDIAIERGLRAVSYDGPNDKGDVIYSPPQDQYGASGRKYDHESLADRAKYLAMVSLSWLGRGPLETAVAAGRDAYITMAHTFAESKGFGVRLLADVKGKFSKDLLGSAISMHAARPFTKEFIYDQDALNEYLSMERDNPDAQLAQTLLSQDVHAIKLHLQQEIAKDPKSQRSNYFKKLIGDINQTTWKDAKVQDKEGNWITKRVPSGDATSMIRLEGARILKEAQRRIENDLLKRGWITHAGAQYKWDDTQKYKLDKFLQQLDMAQRKAEEVAKNGNPLQRLDAKKWLADIKEHRQNVEFAKAHWGDKQLQSVTEQASRELDAQYDREIAGGAVLDYNDAYLPGRYDAEAYNNLNVSFAPKISGRRYTQGKAYENYYDASVGGEVAATHDISHLVEHRIRQGMVRLGRDNWQHEITNIIDPGTGRRAFVLAKSAPNGWKPDLKSGESEQDYTAVSADSSRKPIYALNGGFARLMSALVTPSRIQNNIVGQLALKAHQTLKHISVVADVYHIARESWYSASINGPKGLNFWKGANYVPGWAALALDEKDLPLAQKAGLVDDADVKWLTEKIPFVDHGQKTTMSRMQASKELQKVGFNIGQIRDAIYKDLVKHIPIIGSTMGKMNEWIFDKFTRGVMMKSALQEYERIQKKEPDTNSEAIMRRVAHDLNKEFGSIGKQGWIRDDTFQDISRLIFFAPQWAEGLVMKDAAIPYKLGTRLITGDLKGVKDLVTGHETLARSVARGMIGMFVLTQVLNMITRKQPTWQNQENTSPSDYLDADIGDNVKVSPLSVFNEMTAEVIRYGESKENLWTAMRQIGENKLGFFGRAAMVGATSTSPTGQHLTTTKAVAKEMAKQVLPMPLTMGPGVQQVGSMMSGGRIDPPRSADLRRSEAALLGVKAQVDQTTESKLYSLAQKFVADNKLSAQTEHHEQTDEPSYSKLRSELKLGNEAGAKQMLEGLRKEGKSERQIIEAMSRWIASTYTGSRRNEVLWLRSLTPEELGMYRQAVTARKDLYKKWIQFYTSSRNANTRP